MSWFSFLRAPAKAGAQGGGARNRPWAPAFAGALLLCMAAPLVAQTALPPAPWADRQLDDPAKEEKAKALMETIRCLTCQSQSIADSNASLAADMRSEIRQRIAEGEDPEHIRSWLIERYGDWVSYTPRIEAATWPLFAAPVVLLALGILIVRGRIGRRKKEVA